MKLYFAGAASGHQLLREEGVRRILIAYPDLRSQPDLLEQLEGFDLFLDCGAWSVKTGAIPPIDVRNYIEWLEEERFPFGAVASLDVIDDPVTTRANYHAMRNAGLDVLPTWHAGSPIELAAEYAKDAPRLAIGGLASKARTGLVDSFIAKVWPHVRHRRVHLFGVATTRTLLRFEPESSDMAGWLVGARYGEVYTLSRWPKIKNLDITRRSSGFDRNLAAQLVAEMAKFGMTWRELNESNDARLRYNVRILLEFERRINAVIERRERSRATLAAEEHRDG